MGELRFVQSEEGSGPHAAKAHGLRFAVFAAYGRAANDAPRYQHPIIRCVSHYLVGVGIVPIGGPPLSISVRSEEHTSETPVTNPHLVCRLLLYTKNLFFF